MGILDKPDSGELRTEREALRSKTVVELWLDKIEAVKKDKKREAWLRESRNSVSMYEAGEVKTEGDITDELSGANLWHSNVETMTPAIINSAPAPVVSVRYGDPDHIQKLVCETIERGISFDLDASDFLETMKDVARHGELTGWGIPRIRYFAQSRQIKQDAAQDGVDQSVGLYETVADDVDIECVPWDRCYIDPARTWKRVNWVAFELDMTLDEIDDLCPPTKDPETGALVPRSAQFSVDKAGKSSDKRNSNGDPEPEDRGVLGTIRVYEVWDRKQQQLLFMTDQDKKFPLKVIPDPLKLSRFFPIPKPYYTKRRVNSMQPLAPWRVYSGLFAEFEDITRRINGLISQVRVRGFYDKELEADFERLRTCKDGEYEPCENVAKFAGSNRGLEAAIAHWPLEQIIVALEKAVVHREQIKQLIFETTGVTDALRGSVDPHKKLGQTKIEASFGTQRIQDKQNNMARVVVDIIRMMAEVRKSLTPWKLVKEITNMDFANPPVLMEQSDEEELQGQSGQSQLPPQQAANPQEQLEHDPIALDMAVNEAYHTDTRIFNIDIETDSTIQADMSRDQEQMNLFVTATGTFTQAIVGIIQLLPQTRKPLFKLYAAMCGKFKLGRQGDAALEELSEAAGGQVNSEPDPQIAQAQQQIEQLQQQLQMMQQQADKNASSERIKSAELQSQEKIKGAELAQREQESQSRLAHERDRFMMEDGFRAAEHAIKRRELDQKDKELAHRRLELAANIRGKEHDAQMRSSELDLTAANNKNIFHRDLMKMEQDAIDKAEQRKTSAQKEG